MQRNVKSTIKRFERSGFKVRFDPYQEPRVRIFDQRKTYLEIANGSADEFERQVQYFHQQMGVSIDEGRVYAAALRLQQHLQLSLDLG